MVVNDARREMPPSLSTSSPMVEQKQSAADKCIWNTTSCYLLPIQLASPKKLMEAGGGLQGSLFVARFVLCFLG
jgi:hypothetical protein